MRITEAAGYVEPRDSISHDWLMRLGEWGLTPVLVPNVVADPADYLERIEADILVLTGGEDLGLTPRRDATEAGLLAYAVSRRLPVFGVCRGMQLINHHFGGRTAPVDGHVACTHSVALGPAWTGLYGPSAEVNSYHAHGIAPDELASSLRAAAFDAEGHVEALYHPSLPIAGVMWHSERRGAPAGDARLVATLAAGRTPWT